MTARRTWVGTVYLLHFSQPYQHAQHYCGFAYADDDLSVATPAGLAEIAAVPMVTRAGWRRQITPFQAAGLASRLADHRAGRGANLLAVVTAAGIEFQLARVWVGTREGGEKYLKDRNDRISLCPRCHPGTRSGMVIKPKRYRRSRRPRNQEAMENQCPESSKFFPASDSGGVSSSYQTSAEIAEATG
jgi:hypothetical protein